jgi:hypothetical protein
MIIHSNYAIGIEIIGRENQELQESDSVFMEAISIIGYLLASVDIPSSP